MIDSPALTQARAAMELTYTDPARSCRLAKSARAMAGGDAEAASTAEQALGTAYTALGRLVDAERHLRASIELAEGAGLDTRASEAHGGLAYTLILTGRTAEALAEIDQATPALRGTAAARLQMRRGLVLTEISRFDEAVASFAAALDLLRDAGGDDLLEADLRTNRSILRVHRRDWRGAEDDLRRAEAGYTATGHSGRIAMVYHNRGLAAAVRGDLPAALAAYDEAAERYRVAGRDSGLLPIERAEALLSVRLVAEARQVAEAAVVKFAGQHNLIDLVQARLLLANAALLAGDPATARVEAQRAGQSARRQARPGWAALAAYLTLRAHWVEGSRTAGTLRLGRRTVTALTRAGWVVAALDARLIVARIALELGRLSLARRELAEAGQVRHSGPAEIRARAWHATALLRLSAGDARGAGAALRSGLRVLDRFRASLGATELRAHVSGHGGELASLGLQLAVQSGRAHRVLDWAERWRAGALRLPPVRPPNDAELAGDLAELRQVMVAFGEAAASGTDTQRLLRRQSTLEEQIRRRARHAPGSPVADTALPTSDELGAALGPAALVEYVDTSGLLLAVVLAAGRMRLHQLGPVDMVENELAALRFGLRRLAFRVGSAQSLAASASLVDRKAARLDELLLEPLGGEVGDRPLVIVPTGALHAMPWPTLPSCRGRPVSVAPSAALWHRAATAPGRPGGRRVLVAGPDLPHAVAEVATLARRYPGASRFTGRNAKVALVTTALDGAELGHIAAHGHFRTDNPLFSALRLVDGPLTVYDLERLARPPRHVVLSACDSGLPAVRPGDELLGLTAALLALGSRSLVATVVAVPDEESRPMMVRFHRHLLAGLGPAAALASAQRELASPAAASFVCFGAG